MAAPTALGSRYAASQQKLYDCVDKQSYEQYFRSFASLRSLPPDGYTADQKTKDKLKQLSDQLAAVENDLVESRRNMNIELQELPNLESALETNKTESKKLWWALVNHFFEACCHTVLVVFAIIGSTGLKARVGLVLAALPAYKTLGTNVLNDWGAVTQLRKARRAEIGHALEEGNIKELKLKLIDAQKRLTSLRRSVGNVKQMLEDLKANPTANSTFLAHFPEKNEVEEFIKKWREDLPFGVRVPVT